MAGERALELMVRQVPNRSFLQLFDNLHGRPRAVHIPGDFGVVRIIEVELLQGPCAVLRGLFPKQVFLLVARQLAHFQFLLGQRDQIVVVFFDELTYGLVV